MKITALVENTTNNPALGTQHGLSFYIEANGRKILFDMGECGLFLRNAEKLGIDISAVDLAIISHGHSDHGGGLGAFLSHNENAPVYLNRRAFGHYYTKRMQMPVYIGLDQELERSRRMIFVDDFTELGNGLTLFSGVTGREYASPSNARLFMRKGQRMEPDDSLHEQDLLIQEDGKAVLIGGCAHCGIVNFLEHAKAVLGRSPDIVVSGFHLYESGLSMKEESKFVGSVAKRLRQEPTHYYTCHCTGQRPFEVMKEDLGQQLQYIAAGDTVVL